MKAYRYYECMLSIALAAQIHSQRTTGYGHYAAWSAMVRLG